MGGGNRGSGRVARSIAGVAVVVGIEGGNTRCEVAGKRGPRWHRIAQGDGEQEGQEGRKESDGGPRWCKGEQGSAGWGSTPAGYKPGCTGPPEGYIEQKWE